MIVLSNFLDINNLNCEIISWFLYTRLKPENRVYDDEFDAAIE